MSKRIVLIVIILFLILPGQLPAKFSCETLATDIEVLYLYDEPVSIDWPLIYHLAVEEACRVNLVSLKPGNENRCHVESSEDYNIHSYRFMVKDFPRYDLDSVLTRLNSWRLPDIVILNRNLHNPASLEFERYLLNLNPDDDKVFNIEKILRDVSEGGGDIFINSSIYLSEHYDELSELAAAFSSTLDELNRGQIYSAYSLIKDNTGGDKKPSILPGIEKNRLHRLTEKYIENSMVAASMNAAMDEYIGNILSAVNLKGLEKINSVFDALESLYRLRQEYFADFTSDSSTVVAKYISSLLDMVSSRIFKLAGIDFEFRNALRDTPQGPRLKLMTEIDNNGPLRITAGRISIRPNCNEKTIELSLKQKEIPPFSQFAREFTIDAEIESLVSFKPDSMLITGTIRYRGRNIEYRTFADAYLETPLSVSLVPKFAMIMPVSGKIYERLVEPVKLKAIITKPSFKSATIDIQVVNPPGTMAGAYRKTISMPIGTRSFEVSIPLVATRKLTAGKKRLIINLIENKYIVASDTAFVSRTDTDLNDKVKIALLSGSDGLLEDILVNTGADYRTISNRYLETRDLDQFDILALGTGCYENYPALATVRGKLKKFMEHGGTILVFGQPRNWPADLLPVSILSTEKLLPGHQLEVSKKSHPVFHKTEPSKFLEFVDRRYKSYPALVSPSEPIVLLDDKVSMLTESKFKKGRLIYCGLPLLKMFQNLDFVAITFFSGLINYSGK